MPDQEYLYSGPTKEHPYTYDDFSTPKYLTGHANKIIHDLEKSARLYNGKKVDVYRVDSEERCPECTNAITGERMFSRCTACNGSGTVAGFVKISENQWCYLDISPEYNVPTEVGLVDTPGGAAHNLIFVGPPMLREGDLFITKDTKHIFKIVDVGPQPIAMAGTVVSQPVQVSRLTPKQVEYGLLVQELGITIEDSTEINEEFNAQT